MTEPAWQPPWHSFRPTAWALLERELDPGGDRMLQVPFVQKRADQFARVLYELSQAFEVPEVDPQASLIETALAGFRGELRKPRADNRWAREYWAEVDALFGQAPGAERGE